MKKQQGFTLIELMIVVAVIGVLSAIAVPQYQKYIAKAEAASALASITGLRTNIETFILDEGKFPTLTEVSVPSSALGTITYESVTSAAGSIQLKFKDTGVSPDVATQTISLARTSDGSWSCNTSIADKLQPKGCAAAKAESGANN